MHSAINRILSEFPTFHSFVQSIWILWLFSDRQCIDPQYQRTKSQSASLGWYQLIQQIFFWSIRIFTTVTENKWHRSIGTLQENDLVIIQEENLPSLHWRMNKVKQLHIETYSQHENCQWYRHRVNGEVVHPTHTRRQRIIIGSRGSILRLRLTGRRRCYGDILLIHIHTN